MIKHLLLCATLSFLFSTAQAQLNKAWDKRYGSSGYDEIRTIVSQHNGHLIIAGNSSSSISGDKTVGSYGNDDYWIVCTDSNGTKLWDADFGGSSDEYLSAVIQTGDHGFLFAGTSSSGISGTKTQNCRGSGDYWVVKTDSLGNYQWDKRFGGLDDDYLFAVCATNDGGYLLAGQSYSGISGDKSQACWGLTDYWIVKIDSAGSKLWDKCYGGTSDDVCYSVYQTSGHGFILSGYSSSGLNGNKSQTSWGSYDYWVVRTDSVGTKIWDKRFGTSSWDVCMGGDSDGLDGVVLGGYTDGGVNGDKTQSNWGSYDFWLVHVDSSGNKVWDKRFGGVGSDDTFGNIFRTSDGGYISTGTSYSNISGNKTQANLGTEQTWMVKCSSTGAFVADRTLLTTGHEETGFATATDGGCFIIGNNTSSGIGGDKTQNSQGSGDYFIAKYCVPGMPEAGFVTADSTVCQGQCITFNDASNNFPAVWSWSFPGGTPSSSTLQNPTICYNALGLYDVKLVVSNISGIDTFLRTAYINVSAQIPPPIIVQNGTLLTCTPTASSYQWYLNYVSIPGATNQTYTSVQTGLYSVMVSNSSGCTSISQAFSFNINVALANFSVSDTLICQNGCLSFNDLSLNNPTSWSWSFPGAVTSSSTQQNPANICYYTPGVYSVTLTVTNQYGLSFVSYIDYIKVVANPNAPLISQNVDTLFCMSAAANYQWYLDGSSIPGATDSYYIIPVSGNYGVEITNASGCSASTAYTALLPAPGFAAQDSLLCEKFCTNFMDLSTNNPVSWSWIFDGGNPATSLQQNPTNICYNVPGIYDVTLTTYNGYKYDTLFLAGYMTVFPTPPVPIITIMGDTLWSTSSFAYQWMLNEVDIPGATNQSYGVTQSGVYTIKTYSEDGCTAQVSMYVDLTAINTIYDDQGFEIFPNPGSGIFSLKFNSADVQPLTWYVNDVIGSMIPGVLPEKYNSGGQTMLDLTLQKDGLYFIHVCYKNGCVVKKIVKHATP